MISIQRPSVTEINAYLARVSRLPFNYRDVGASRIPTPPPGYSVDHRRVLVGLGEPTFHAALECLRRWDAFQLGWVSVCWPHLTPTPGTVVATLTRLYGSWWLNPCRVIYVDEQPRRLCFAYGTLADHFAEGEERFTVEWLDDGTVWYDLFAFSRPRSFLARWGYPLMRLTQRRAGDQSMPAFVRAVRRRLTASPLEGLA